MTIYVKTVYDQIWDQVVSDSASTVERRKNYSQLLCDFSLQKTSKVAKLQ